MGEAEAGLEMSGDRVAIFVTTLYEGLGFEGIDCVDFTKAVESGIAELPTYAVINQDRTKDCFFVYLGFDRISDEVTAVSAVLCFHEGTMTLTTSCSTTQDTSLAGNFEMTPMASLLL